MSRTLLRESSCSAMSCWGYAPLMSISCVNCFCAMDCSKPRCTLHRGRLPVCSIQSELVRNPHHHIVSVGTYQTHCTHPQRGREGSVVRQSRSIVCQVPSCPERAHQQCNSGRCTLHCSSPLSLTPKRGGGGTPVNTRPLIGLFLSPPSTCAVCGTGTRPSMMDSTCCVPFFTLRTSVCVLHL